MEALSDRFCVIHNGFAIAIFPVFIILGLMVERGYTWGQRALVRSAINALTMIDSITVYLGGTRLDSYPGMFASIGLQIVALVALGVWALDRVRRSMALVP